MDSMDEKSVSFGNSQNIKPLPMHLRILGWLYLGLWFLGVPVIGFLTYDGTNVRKILLIVFVLFIIGGATLLMILIRREEKEKNTKGE